MKKKYFRNLILFILIILLTFYIILKDQSISKIIDVLSSIDLKYILIAIICMCVYLICEAINIGRTLKALGEKSTFYRNIKYALIGFFFSSVTPAASGGQPMQIYYMNKDKISVANSTLSLLINLTSMQIVTISIAIISLFFNYGYMNSILIGLFIIGIFLNATALGLLLVSLFSKRMTKGLINIAIKILEFLKIKNIEDKKKKLEDELSKYQASATYIKSNKKVILKTIIITYFQFLMYYSISYWVYRSFGLKEYNILQILSMQSVLFATVSGIPSPGAVGVSEGGFLEIFRNVYSDNILNEAMLLNRGVNFYLFVIISSVIVMLYTVKDKKEEKLTDK
ncbi:MAG: flippase-like domain-containing protein [Clostridia bacterium]|nr:flippase-like domain-containing protein [Clostridia bacterium]